MKHGSLATLLETLNPFNIGMISKLVTEDPRSASPVLLLGTPVEKVFLWSAIKKFNIYHSAFINLDTHHSSRFHLNSRMRRCLAPGVLSFAIDLRMRYLCTNIHFTISRLTYMPAAYHQSSFLRFEEHASSIS